MQNLFVLFFINFLILWCLIINVFMQMWFVIFYRGSLRTKYRYSTISIFHSMMSLANHDFNMIVIRLLSKNSIFFLMKLWCIFHEKKTTKSILNLPGTFEQLIKVTKLWFYTNLYINFKINLRFVFKWRIDNIFWQGESPFFTLGPRNCAFRSIEKNNFVTTKKKFVIATIWTKFDWIKAFYTKKKKNCYN